jgi:hypothetical protein
MKLEILIPDKQMLSQGKFIKVKKRHYLMIKGLIFQKDIKS